jgi:rhomboid protease GluP
MAEQYRVSFQSFLEPARNPYRLRGEGSAAIFGDDLIISGKRSRPFWFSRRTEVRLARNRIRDVACEGNRVSLEIDPDAYAAAPEGGAMVLFLGNETAASSLAYSLPTRLSDQARRERGQMVEYETKLATTSSGWVTAVLATLNVVVYLYVSFTSGGWVSVDGRTLIALGANFGPLTSSGEWWRLLSATFLHGGLVHLLINMAALCDVGRTCERLYGSGRFLVLYLVSGLLGSAASLWWNPPVASVGASGAVFGVLGATFIYMLDKSHGVPLVVMKKHQVSLTIFILYALVNGLLAKAGIDNAAHVGGLVGGLVLGYAFARPLGVAPRAAAGWKPATGLVACLLAIGVLAAITPNTRPQYEAEQRFIAELHWFDAEEKRLLAETQAFLARASKPRTPLAQIRPEAAALSGQWGAAHARFAQYRLPDTSRLNEIHRDMQLYLDLRQRAFQALARPTGNDPVAAQAAEKEFMRLWKESNVVVDRMNERNKKLIAGKKGTPPPEARK